MRIVYLHQYFNTPDSPGGGVRSFEIARRLVLQGHDVTIVTADRQPGAVRRETHESGIRVHWIPVEYQNEMSNPQRVASFAKFAIRSAITAANIECDLVYASSTPLTIIFPAVVAKLRRRVPLVFEVRDLWPELPIAVGALSSPLTITASRALERFAYWAADRIVALSPGMRDGVTRTGYPSQHVLVSPNASDVDFFDVSAAHGRDFRARHDWLQDRPLVIYVGTFGLLNGVDYLAQVASEVRKLEPEVRFLAVGSGRGYDEMRRVAERHGIWEETFFTIERVPKREVPAIYSAANLGTSLFIDLPEMQANSANKFFDCMAASTPIAINYGGWHAETVEAHGAGVLLSPSDPKAAAASIMGCLNDSEWLAESALAARNLADTAFNRDLLTEELEAFLLDASPRRRRRITFYKAGKRRRKRQNHES